MRGPVSGLVWFLALAFGIGLLSALVRNSASAPDRTAPLPPIAPRNTQSEAFATGAPGDSATAAGTAGQAKSPAPTKPGLSINHPRAFQGYTLVASMASRMTYLIDIGGHVVQSWKSDRAPALSAYLLENGHLLRTGALLDGPHPLNGSGAGGRIQEFDWDGRLVWDFQFAPKTMLPHHDLTRLPNGNILLIAWEEKTPSEATAAGRTAATGDGYLFPDCLLEIKPTGKTSGQIVWEWHVWDHLIQDVDPGKPNYGDVAAHPERIDLNFGESPMGPMIVRKTEVEKLRSIGYLGAGNAMPTRAGADWTHLNSVDYHAELDQIVLTAHAFSEIWIIDHSTTTAEAAGRTGGRRGKGGDLLARWGNPRAYHAGTKADQRLFFPHDAHWVRRGLPGEGNLLIFNNGARRPDGPHSTVDEIALRADESGRYDKLPEQPVWSYGTDPKERFYAMLISGAQRLPNGNTLICSGMSGSIFEVTPEKEIVWRYNCPVRDHDRDGRKTGYMDFGPPSGSSVFRARRYGPDYPGLAGRKLTPGPTIEALQARAHAKQDQPPGAPGQGSLEPDRGSRR